MDADAPRKPRVAVIGLGNRGLKYLRILADLTSQVDVAAIVDSDSARIARATRWLEENAPGVRPVAVSSLDRLLDSNLNSYLDAAIIATPESYHHSQALALLRAGVHILVEKPLCTDRAHAQEIIDAANARGLVAGVCYVLRYHPYYRKMRGLIAEGSLGKPVTVTHRLNVGIDRSCHTFVRGPWGNAGATSPIALSKCCHDTDIVSWLVGETPDSLTTLSSRRFFTPENAPAGAAPRCVDCPIEADCDYSAVSLYLRRHQWIDNFDTNPGHPTLDSAIDSQLRHGPYGKCVFAAQNTVDDRLLISMTFPGGALASITMNMFTADDARDTHICLTHGEIHGDGSVITVIPLASRLSPDDPAYRPVVTYDFSHLPEELHGGADRAMIADFVNAVSSPTHTLQSPASECVATMPE